VQDDADDDVTARPADRARVRTMQISEFDRWVSANNIPETFEYSKGWWDYIELVRRLAFRLATDDVRVVGSYIVDTPPPCERLPMPAVAITTPGVTFALRYDFGSWSLKHISIKIASAEWGDGVVEELAATIARQYPGMRGYTRPNLFRLRQFYESYRDDKKVSALLRQLPWTTTC
jgi:hypothetical protein